MQVLIGNFAALLTLAEVGLGSFLHALHIPFSGHFLSLNQGLILTQACRQVDSRAEAVSASNGISIVTATLKSLSPIGKRLTPMLAISVQGFLYSIGIFVFGNNVLGVLIGMSLLSLWGFAQPLLLAYLFFGERLFLSVEKLWMDLASTLSIPAEYGFKILLGFVIFKILLAWIVGFLGMKKSFTEKYLSKISQYQNPLTSRKTQASALRGSFKDLFNPWMIFSLILTVGFMALTEQSDYFQIFVYGLRVIATAWLCFWILRAFPQSWTQHALNRFPSLKKAADLALARAAQKR